MKLEFNKGSAFNTWEPNPYGASDEVVEKQMAAYIEMTTIPITWKFKTRSQICFDWSLSDLSILQVDFIAESESWKVMLGDYPYHGFPDPPRWGLYRCVVENSDKWERCGFFSTLPKVWKFLSTGI